MTTLLQLGVYLIKETLLIKSINYERYNPLNFWDAQLFYYNLSVVFNTR